MDHREPPRGARASIRSIVIGAGGYGGGELVSILLGHPDVDVVALFGSERHAAPRSFGELFPRWRGVHDVAVAPFDVEAAIDAGADVVFLATPEDVSAAIAPRLAEHVPVVIDLSGAFRLPRGTAVYGLPEVNREAIANAAFIATPGCYPTAAILPLHPLVEAGAVAGRVIVDAVSGVSGAGRAPGETVHFCEVSLQPYKVLEHRHQPEIETYSGADVVFTPHLGAFPRGIVATIHVPLAPSWSEDDVRDLLHGRYDGEPFIRLLDQGDWPSVSAVAGTSYCDIGLASDAKKSHLVVVSAIDNLRKGAASQAVQVMNTRFGFPETAGLLEEAVPCRV